MLKLCFCLRRLPHLSRQAFQDYWRKTHGPLVERHAADLGILRYVQVHTLDGPLNEALRRGRGGPEPYDGVAELWWRDADALGAALARPEGRRAAEVLLEDERRFIDLTRSPLWVAQEHEILQRGEAAPGP